MKKLRLEKPDTFLVLCCYALGVVAMLAWMLGGFITNAIMRGADALQEAELTLDDFELYELQVQKGRLVTTGGDPRLILKDTERRVDSVMFQATYTREPLKVNVYYATPGQDHSPRRMVYGDSDGLFLLPPGGGQVLRIDPGVVAGNTIIVSRIVINQPRSWVSFFVPDAAQWALLVVAPGLLACVVKLVWQTKDMLRARRAVKPA